MVPMSRRPRYADSPRLLLLRWLRDPHVRFLCAASLQDRFKALADEAGHIKMRATVELVDKFGGDVEHAAGLIGRDPRWVGDVLRTMDGVE